MKKIKIRTKDIQNIRFLSDHEIIIGQYVLSYSWSDPMLTALEYGIIDCMHKSEELSEFEYSPSTCVEIRELTPEEDNQAETTLSDLLCTAIDHFFSLGAPDVLEYPREEIKEAPIMMGEVYGMKDIFMYALQRYGISYLSNDCFIYYLYEMRSWWGLEYLNPERAYNLLHEFFTRYLPIIYGRSHIMV